METRILLENDRELIVAFERGRLQGGDPMEVEMKTWDARWRKEALEHYLPQGWSFGTFQAGKLVGYFLGQPYMFHRGLTQTLWIEWLSAVSNEAARELVDTAHKWARDKHLQTVLLENNQSTSFILQDFPKAMLVDDGLIELRSARF